MMNTGIRGQGDHAVEAASLEQYLKDYYGKRLQSAADLSQKACCTDETKQRHKEILELLPDEVLMKHYGCGCPIPPDDLKGLTVVDFGSGAGVDAFVLSYLVGPSGKVHGLDMTEEQLQVARRAVPTVMTRFGYPAPNIEFHHDFIELASCLPDRCADLVISDCVVNLSPRKDQVFQAIHRILKPGGECYISDIVSDRRVPDTIKLDAELVAECLGGAEYEPDYFDFMKEAGFQDPRVVARRTVQEEVRGEPITFSSLTVRAFAMMPPLDRRCEDYGQVATYLGNCPTSPARFRFDDHHAFEAHRPAPVCRNTARMLSESRLSRYFRVTDPVKHFGLFACGISQPEAEGEGGRHGHCC